MANRIIHWHHAAPAAGAAKPPALVARALRHGIRTGLAALLLLAALPFWPTAALGAGLFGTVEFKRPLSSLPAWETVRNKNAEEPIFLKEKVFRNGVTWEKFQQEAAGKTGVELLRYVNAFWNRFPYREDKENWGLPDYWAWPNAFLQKSGDCEDYAIIKYFTLKELGVPVEKMRIVVLRDTLRRLPHAVLAVYTDDDILILDNLSNSVLSHTRLRNYSPQFSFNEQGRWAHMKGKKISE